MNQTEVAKTSLVVASVEPKQIMKSIFRKTCTWVLLSLPTPKLLPYRGDKYQRYF